MKRATQAIIGTTMLLLGAAFVLWGLLDEESNVRQVEAVLADPQAHTNGAYTVMGIPQVNGTAERHHRWTTQDGVDVVTTLTLHAVRQATGPGPETSAEHTTWTLRNRTVATGTGTVLADANTTWTLAGPHQVFLVENFHTDSNPRQALWAIYAGTLREPLQPKPSQFTGQVSMQHGVPLLMVEEVTVGCSSKFLPEEYQEGQAESSAA